MTKIGQKGPNVAPFENSNLGIRGTLITQFLSLSFHVRPKLARKRPKMKNVRNTQNKFVCIDLEGGRKWQFLRDKLKGVYFLFRTLINQALLLGERGGDHEDWNWDVRNY